MYGTSSLESRLTEIIHPFQRNTFVFVTNRKWQRCTTEVTIVVVVMISARFTFSQHLFEISAQSSFLFCLSVVVCHSDFSFICKIWTGLFPLSYFVSDCTLYGKIWLQNQETLLPPLLIRSDQLQLPLETSCFVATKVLWYFVNFQLTSEWVEYENWSRTRVHTHTHTHTPTHTHPNTRDTTADWNISYCFDSYTVHYRLRRD
jgi:hypothetical protein